MFVGNSTAIKEAWKQVAHQMTAMSVAKHFLIGTLVMVRAEWSLLKRSPI